MITCRELTDFLHDYVSGDLAQAQHAEFERHLAVCPPCVRYLSSYRKTIEVGRDCLKAPETSLPPMPEELVRAILAARKK
ncbi:MAG: zf-HC2 domain-containing protein [Phycisphaerae bacterium]